MGPRLEMRRSKFALLDCGCVIVGITRLRSLLYDVTTLRGLSVIRCILCGEHWGDIGASRQLERLHIKPNHGRGFGSLPIPLWRLICTMGHQACRIRALKRDHPDLRQLQDELLGLASYVCFTSSLIMPHFGVLAPLYILRIAICGCGCC